MFYGYPSGNGRYFGVVKGGKPTDSVRLDYRFMYEGTMTGVTIDRKTSKVTTNPEIINRPGFMTVYGYDNKDKVTLTIT